MHLRQSDETVRFAGAARAGAEASSNGQGKTSTNDDSSERQDVKKANGAEIPVPEGRPHGDVIDAIFAGWTIFLHRYHGDALKWFGWSKTHQDNFSNVSFEALDFRSLQTVTDIVGAAKNLQYGDESVRSSDSSVLFVRDGVNDEWSFEARVEIKESRIRISSDWRSPKNAQWQAMWQLQSFASILTATLSEPRCSISRLLDLSTEEINQIWRWTTPLPDSIDQCMHDIISERARLHPQKIAVDAWDGKFTYQQVDEYSTELAKNLRLLNDSDNQVVPVLFEKSRWTMVAVLAVMKAGACFALLDPAQPEGRLSTIIQQTKAKLLVCSKAQSSLASRVADGATVVPVSESKFSKIYGPYAEQIPNASLPPVSPSSLMYLQFTSGSTGVPKACMLSHSHYTSGALPRAQMIGYNETSRVLDFASYAFDVSIDSMLCALAFGSTLCTPSEERRMNDLSGAMRDMRVNLAGMTPSVVRTLDPDILPSLERLAVGGEGISASDAVSWQQKTTVVNCYGPSECTVGATYNNTVGSRPYISMGSGSGCSIWIVDPTYHNKLVPPGAVGELLIEGPIVGYGYLNNPEKTAEAFIQDPEFLTAGSKETPGRRGRMYKTGDLARYDPDGNGEAIFIGRGDQQVKLRGQRIELAEIEFNMLKHLPTDTRVAAEVIEPGGTGEATLIAFVAESRESGAEDLDGDVFAEFSSEFKEALQNMNTGLLLDLPVYMVPSAYIPLWKMPLLVSWKTDRKRLREIGSSITRKDLRKFSAAISSNSATKSEMALRLEKLWAKVLGGEVDFNAGDNFFSMGGDSLRAMKLVAAAREEGIALSVPDVMLNPTLSAMAMKARATNPDDTVDVPAFSLVPKSWGKENARVEIAKLCNTTPDCIEDVYPCTSLQEGLMALSAKFVDAYVAQRVAELPLPVAERLVEAFDKIVQSSPILRTRIVNVPGQGLLQAVLKDGQLRRHHNGDLQRYLELDREEHMDLGTALFRYGLVTQPGGEKGSVIMTAHHAVYDGWSMPLIFDRVNSEVKGIESPRPLPFKNFIKYLINQDTSLSHQYWQNQLCGANPHQFPPLPQKGYITRANSLLEHYVNVPASVPTSFTVPTMIRGAWAVVASLYLGHPDVVFGETLTGRSAPVAGIEMMEGPMITTVPTRTQVDASQPISAYLEAVHKQTADQMPHEHFGLQNIRRVSREAREVCELRTGLVLHPKEDPDTVTPLEEAPANGFLPSDDAEAAREALKFNTYALMLVCTSDDDGFLIMASFDSNCISSPVMERVLKVLDRVVTAFLHSPEEQLGAVMALEPQELEDAAQFRVKESVQELKSQVPTNGQEKTQAVKQTDTWTPNETKLRALLAHVLGVPETDINSSDSFFELGGDSISAMRLVSEGRAQGFNLTVANIFKSQSIAELAAGAENENEKSLIEILNRVLGMSKAEIDPSDSFFELGGDSIAAMRLVAECRAAGLEITVSQIFGCKSISELAAAVKEASSASLHAVSNVPFASLGEDVERYSVERVQSLLENPEWSVADIYPARFLQKIAVDGTISLPRYSLRYELIKFDGPVDEARLAQSCQELVARNEILRTVFVEVEGRCLGVVLDSLNTPLENISIPDSTASEAFIQSWIDTDTQAPKPYGSSFVSFTLLTSSTGASTLAFRISHAQYDEMCLPILFSQLSALYSGVPVPPSEPFTNHVNHVVQQSIPASIPYWKDLLASSQISVFRPDIPLTTRESTSLYAEFDISARPKGITIGSLPTAAWAVVLAKRLQTRDVVFGEVVTGRNLGVAHADRVIGPSWQYAPFRVRFSPKTTYLSLLQDVQNQHIASSAHEGMGLEEIVEQCTNWGASADEKGWWYDSVVHQAPTYWVEKMDFGDVKADFETVYPHKEPLREWKCQAFVQDGGKKLGIEIVTFEEWRGVGEEVLREVGEVLGLLIKKGEGRIFEE